MFPIGIDIAKAKTCDITDECTDTLHHDNVYLTQK